MYYDLDGWRVSSLISLGTVLWQFDGMRSKYSPSIRVRTALPVNFSFLMRIVYSRPTHAGYYYLRQGGYVSGSLSGSGSPPKFNHLFTGPLPIFPWKFHANLFRIFGAQLLTGRQTNRQTIVVCLCLFVCLVVCNFGPVNKWLSYGGDPDLDLDKETDRDTGNTCLGGGMHGRSASSYYYFFYYYWCLTSRQCFDAVVWATGMASDL